MFCKRTRQVNKRSQLKRNILLSYYVLLASTVGSMIMLYFDMSVCKIWSSSELAFSLLAVGALMGIWRLRRCNEVPVYFTFMTFLISIYALPLLCIDMYRYSCITHPMYYLHIFYPGVIFLTSFIIARHGYDPKYRHIPEQPTFIRIDKCCSVDMVNLVSLISYAFVSIFGNNICGLIAVSIYGVCLYLKNPSCNFTCLATVQNNNLLMSAFCLMAAKALVNTPNIACTVNIHGI